MVKCAILQSSTCGTKRTSLTHQKPPKKGLSRSQSKKGEGSTPVLNIKIFPSEDKLSSVNNQLLARQVEGKILQLLFVTEFS